MSDDKTTGSGKKERIGSTPAQNEWDPGPVVDARIMKGFGKEGREPAPSEEDPLEAKHKSRAYREDFRTLDYGDLSTSQAAREAQRRKIKASHTSWVPPKTVEKAEPPASSAQFASFGGSTIQAEVIRGGERLDQPSMTPHLPTETDWRAEMEADLPSARAPLAAPDPHGRTPNKDRRVLIGDDPLAEKHKSPAFDRNWRTVDYAHLSPEEREAADREAAENRQGPEDHLEDAQLSGTVSIGTEPLRLESPREGGPDALTRIEGIGPAMERLLFERGIFHFDQIAGLTDDNIVWLEASLACDAGRTGQEGWVRQAIDLSTGS